MKKHINLFIVVLSIFIFIPTLNAGSNDTALSICSSGAGHTGYSYKDNTGATFKMWFAHYKFQTGDDAFCLDPGIEGPDNTCVTYYEDTTFDLSECSTNWSTDCALAYIISKHESYSYQAVELASRLYNVVSKSGYNKQTGIDGNRYADYVAVYQNTANAILKWGYDGTNYEEVCKNRDCEGVLFGSGIDEGIELFLEARDANGEFGGWTPKVEVTSATLSGKNMTIKLSTNFNSQTKVIFPKTISGYSVKSASCSGSTCTIVINVPSASNGCVFVDFSITFEDDRYLLGTIKKYKPAGATRQYFMGLYSGENIIHLTANTCTNTNKNCCSDMTIKNNVPNSCNTSSEGTVEDPSMCTIINACDKGRQASYDYTDEYGLNKKYCSLYCREEIKLTFMDKTDVIAGRQFKYDVNSRFTTKHMLSTVIEGTQQCTSHAIDYLKWEKDYLAKNSEVVDNWNNWKLWETRYNHETAKDEYRYTPGCSGCNNCCNCEKCNCVSAPVTGKESCDTCCDPGPGGGSLSISWTWYKWTNAYYNRTNTRYQSNGFLSSYSNDRTSGNGQSGSSSGSCSCSACSGSSCTDHPGTSAYGNMVAYRRAYNRALTEREQLIKDIENCNILSDTPVYKGIVTDYKFNSNINIDYSDQYSNMIDIGSEFVDDDYDVSISYYKTADNSITKIYEKLCPNCNSKLENSITSSSSYKNVDYWVCSGSETGASCTNNQISVPNNNSVNMEVTKEQHFWQSQEFYTQLYTGTVSTSPNGQGVWIGLDDYIYPIELNKVNGEYGVFVDYSNLGSATRPSNIKIKDGEFECAFNVINESIIYECDPQHDLYCDIECDPTDETCDPNPSAYSKLGYVVRSVDLTNLFPNDITNTNPNGRVRGMNWANSVSVIEAIEELGNDIFTEKKPQYVIHLTPANIRKIKEYNNETGRTYLDYSVTCTSSGYCESEFLNDIRDDDDYANLVDLTLGRNKSVDDKNNLYRYNLP